MTLKSTSSRGSYGSGTTRKLFGAASTELLCKRLGSLFEPGEKLGQCDPEGLRDQHQVVKAQIAFTSFHRSHPRAVNARNIREGFLRETLLLARFTNSLTKHPAKISCAFHEFEGMPLIRLQYLRRQHLSSISETGKSLPLSGVCIYTIVSPDKLIQSVRDHKPLHEEKRWVSAAQNAVRRIRGILWRWVNQPGLWVLKESTSWRFSHPSIMSFGGNVADDYAQ